MNEIFYNKDEYLKQYKIWNDEKNSLYRQTLEVDRNKSIYTMQQAEDVQKKYKLSTERRLKLYLFFTKNEVEILTQRKKEDLLKFFEKHQIWIKKLIKNLNFKAEYGEEWGYIYVCGKRPFGNSDYYRDIAEIVSGGKITTEEIKETQLDYHNYKNIFFTNDDIRLIYRILPYFFNKILQEI